MGDGTLEAMNLDPAVASHVAAAGDAAVDGPTMSKALIVGVLVLGGLVLTRVSGFVIRQVVRRVATRSLVAPSSWWRHRSRRVGGESFEMGEQRRRQRIDAASRMLNHLMSLVMWIVITIVGFHLLDIDAAFFLSSAGFLGAAVAIGGQHKVNDYLTGLTVHFEDRYGVGDEIVVEVGWTDPVHAVVDHIGLFSTRLRDAASTMHFPNHALSQLRNLSQEATTTTLQLAVDGSPAADEVADAIRGLAGSSELTDVIFLGDIAAYEPHTGQVAVDVRTLRPLDEREAQLLTERAQRVLVDGRGRSR
jgi:small-conductance mechanosensitive channel